MKEEDGHAANVSVKPASLLNVMSTEVAEQSTVLIDVISSSRMEGNFIVALTSAMMGLVSVEE